MSLELSTYQNPPLEHFRVQVGNILSAMEAERLGYLSLAAINPTYADFAFQFNKSARLLSEMPVCGFVYNEDVIAPHGFTYGSGNIKMELCLGEEVKIYSMAHNFWFDPKNDTVACLCFSQFVDPYNNNTLPGDRLKVAISRASDLIQEVVPGLYLLLGTRSEIYELLRIEYPSF